MDRRTFLKRSGMAALGPLWTRELWGRDARSLEIAAHSVKGMAVTFAASPVADAASILESMGRQGQVNWCTEAYASLKKEFSRLQIALTDLRERILIASTQVQGITQ